MCLKNGAAKHEDYFYNNNNFMDSKVEHEETHDGFYTEIHRVSSLCKTNGVAGGGKTYVRFLG